jgi:hypothetical protein
MLMTLVAELEDRHPAQVGEKQVSAQACRRLILAESSGFHSACDRRWSALDLTICARKMQD